MVTLLYSRSSFQKKNQIDILMLRCYQVSNQPFKMTSKKRQLYNKREVVARACEIIAIELRLLSDSFNFDQNAIIGKHSYRATA